METKQNKNRINWHGVRIPAVDQDRPGEGWIDRLDLLQELEHADWRERNSKVGPAGEVELGERSGGFGVVTCLLNVDTNNSRGLFKPCLVTVAEALIYLSLFFYIYLSLSLSTYICLHLFLCISTYLYLYLSILSISTNFYLFYLYLSTSMYIYLVLSIYG